MSTMLRVSGVRSGGYARCAIPKGYVRVPSDVGYDRLALEQACGTEIESLAESQLFPGSWYMRVDQNAERVLAYLASVGATAQITTEAERLADETARLRAWGLVAYADAR